jgi:hypothetical protein
MLVDLVARDTLIHISQVHLSEPEFEIDNDQGVHEASIAFPGSRVDGPTWLSDAVSHAGGLSDGSASVGSMRNGFSVPVTPTTTTPDSQCVTYSHDAVHVAADRAPQSHEFFLTVGHSQCVPTTKANSFDFNSRDYGGTLQSAIVSPNMSSRPVEALHHSDRAALPSYLNQQILITPPPSAGSTVFWDPSIHNAGPVYQHTY